MQLTTQRAAWPLVILLALGAPHPLVRAQQATEAVAQTLEQELQALTERFEAAQEAFYGELSALYAAFDEEKATPEEKATFEAKYRAIDERAPGGKFAPEFIALAERAQGSEVAAKAWLQVLQIGGGDPSDAKSPARRALERLLTDHLSSPALEPLAEFLQYGAWSLGRATCLHALRKLEQGSPHAAVKAASAYALALVLMDGDATAEEKAEARQKLLELQRDFGALPVQSRNSTYGALAGRNLFELDHLQIAMQAPDFEAVDQDGAKFKLSDYRGKVVVVDFWGFW